MKKLFLAAIFLTIAVMVCPAQDSQPSPDRQERTSKPVRSRTPYVINKKNAVKASPVETQAVRELAKKESDELRALADASKQARQRQQAELKAAEEQLKELRKKHLAELEAISKQEAAVRKKYRSERAALATPRSSGTSRAATGTAPAQAKSPR